MFQASVDDKKTWKILADDRAAGLQIILPKSAHVLPWCHFLWAEGDSGEIRIAFTTHDVVVKGSGLDALLGDIAAQRIVELKQPLRAERFGVISGTCIREIAVTKVDSEGNPLAPLEHPMKSNCLEYARIISNVGGDGEWMTTFA